MSADSGSGLTAQKAAAAVSAAMALEAQKQLSRARFLISAAKLHQCPPDSGCEVAFVGRSNAGKSSAINTLTRQRGLARTSKTPGRTRLLNFFSLGDDSERRLVDLPGYGYAKVPAAERAQWGKVLENYISSRQSLTAIVLIMDIRHPLQALDRQLLEFTGSYDKQLLVLLTRADKISRSRGLQTMRQVQRDIGSKYAVQLFSSLKKTGLNEAGATILNYLEQPDR